MRMQPGIDHTGVTIVYLCHDGNGRYLFQKRGEQCRDEHGRWDCGGGKLEWGMTVEDTLRKEIGEEYGTTVRTHSFLGYRDVHRTHNGCATHWIALDFLVEVDPSTVCNNEPHKFSEIGWFTKTSIPQPLHTQLPKFFHSYDNLL